MEVVQNIYSLTKIKIFKLSKDKGENLSFNSINFTTLGKNLILIFTNKIIQFAFQLDINIISLILI